MKGDSMTVQELSNYRQNHADTAFHFFTDIFTKAIWGDMGEDTASITLTIQKNHWHLHFIRTQSGEPYPLSETVCNVIDEYEKDLSDEELYEFLAHHCIIQELENHMQNNRSTL